MLAHLSCVIVFKIRLAKQSSSSNIEHAYTIQMQRKDTLTNNHNPNAHMETSRRGGMLILNGWLNKTKDTCALTTDKAGKGAPLKLH
jgi:hypothetical protein